MPHSAGAVDFTGATSVDFTGATITGTSFLTSYTETDPVVGAITGLVKPDGAGNIRAVAGTDYSTTVAFADPTGKPTHLLVTELQMHLHRWCSTGSSLDTNTQTSVAIWPYPDNYVLNKQ